MQDFQPAIDLKEYLRFFIAVRIRTAGFWESYPRGPKPTW